jgi:putative oligomerization/nucleic acid binding protein
VQRRQYDRWAAESEQQAMAVQPSPPEEPSYTAELERLAQLRAQGILTDEEFQSKKKAILGI